MPNSQPLLTIAIPTYNRSRYLARLLDSLMPQLALETKVELLISDNASPDETSSIIEEYRRNGLVLRSISNPENIGADGNINQCFVESAGKYVWIVGDDDVIVPNAISIVMTLLGQDEYDLIHLLGTNLEEGVSPARVSVPPRVAIIHDAKTFALRTHVFLTFITGNIVNKNRVLSLPHEPFSSLIGTSLVQLGWIYTALAQFRKGACILDIMVAAGAEDRGGYALYTVFGANLKRLTEAWFAETALTRIILNGTIQVFFPAFVLRSRMREGPFIEENHETLLASLYSSNPRYFFFIYPLLKLPAGIGKLWLLLIRITNRLNKAFGNPMLR